MVMMIFHLEGNIFWNNNFKAMIDISKEKVKIECPACGAKVEATLREVAFGVSIICKCGQKIRIEDKDGSTSRGIKDVNRAFSDLEKAFKKIGK